MTASTDEFRSAARAYIEHGWHVLPIHAVLDKVRCTCGHPRCGQPGKHPATRHGYRDASDDPSIIDEWTERLTRNIAIATGGVSGVVVINVDPRNGGDEAWDEFEAMFPEVDFTTYRVASGGGGFHLYYALPGGIADPTVPNLLRGVDLKGDGGYVIAPPSNHASGGVYRLLADADLAPLPEPIVGMLRSGVRPAGLRHTPAGAVRGVGITTQRQQEIFANPAELGPGERDTFFTFTARDLRRRGSTFEETLKTLGAVYEGMHNPPDDFFQPDQVVQKVQRAFESVEPVELDLGRTLALPLADTLVEADSDASVPTVPDGAGFDEHGFVPSDQAFYDLFVRQRGHQFRFVPGLGWYCLGSDNTWHGDAEPDVHQAVIDVAEDVRLVAEHTDDFSLSCDLKGWYKKLSGFSHVEATVRALRNRPQLRLSVEKLDANPNIIPFCDGALDFTRYSELSTEERAAFASAAEELDALFRRCVPEDYVSRTLQSKYDAYATPDFFLRRLEEWFPDEDVRNYVQEIVGYILCGTGTERVFFIFYGAGANGKSVFLDFLQRLLGPLSTSLNDEVIERGYRQDIRRPLSDLVGRRLCVTSETRQGAHLNTTLIKQLTGGDRLKAAKVYQDEIEFVNRATLIMQTNHEPTIREFTVGLWDRIWTVPFTASWPIDDPRRLPRKVLDEALWREREGIAMWAIEGYLRYVYRGMRFDPPKAVLDAKRELETANDIVKEFAESCVEPSETEWIPKPELLKAFRAWAHENGKDAAMADKTVYSELKRAGVRDRSHPERRGTRVYAVKPVWGPLPSAPVLSEDDRIFAQQLAASVTP
jgi:putative DNA primase/helicase